MFEVAHPSVKGVWAQSLSPLALGIAKASLNFRVKRSGRFLWVQARIAVLPIGAGGISKALNDLTLWPRRLF